jgi:hypothetical protein
MDSIEKEYLLKQLDNETQKADKDEIEKEEVKG